MRAPPLATVVLPLLATALAAQGTRIVPPLGAVTDQNSQALLPFAYSTFRFQQVWTGSSIARQNASISALAYRRDTQDNSPCTAYGYSRLTVRIGHTTVGPSTMSTTFANNTPMRLTTGFSGPFTPPPQQPELGLAPFNVLFALQAPFQFQTSTGNLIVELEAQGPQLPKKWYPIDAAYVGLEGRIFGLGQPGTFGSGETPFLSMNRAAGGLDRVVPGGQIGIRVSNMLSPYPSWINFGLSTQLWAGGRLPYDLGIVGAPGNTLYVSLDALTTQLIPQLSGSRYVVDLTAQIPNVPVLAGQSFYNQSLHLDPGANALQAVLSRGMQVLIGGMSGTSESQLMGEYGTTATTGRFLFATGMGAPVTWFAGSFN